MLASVTALASAAPVLAQSATQTVARSQSDLAAVAKAREDSARRPYTAADVHFMSGMIGHHSQAIVMAGWAPSHGASPSVHTLSDRIINAQRDEIATMQQWLRDRQQPVPETSASSGSGKLRPYAFSARVLGLPTFSDSPTNRESTTRDVKAERPKLPEACV